jgi:hypothetical protein
MPVNRDALSIKPSSMFNVVRIKASPGCIFVYLYMHLLYAVVKHIGDGYMTIHFQDAINLYLLYL